MIRHIEAVIFRHRHLTLALFAMATLTLGWFALKTRVDAASPSNSRSTTSTSTTSRSTRPSSRRQPGRHRPRRETGDIFTAEFFKTLKAVTDEVLLSAGRRPGPGHLHLHAKCPLHRGRRGGLQGGNVVPGDFQPTPGRFRTGPPEYRQVRPHGMLVSADYTGAAVILSLQEVDPATGRNLDYSEVAAALETKIRAKYQSGNIGVHIIGFAKVIGDVRDGARGVLLFFGIASRSRPCCSIISPSRSS